MRSFGQAVWMSSKARAQVHRWAGRNQYVVERIRFCAEYGAR